MRVSPTGRKRNTISSSPFQTMKINPSPKGGLLMKLTDEDEQETSPRSKQKKKPKSRTKSMSKDNYTISKAERIAIQSQDKLQLIVKDQIDLNQFSDISVNPSLLLSSPITSKVKEFKKPEIIKKSNSNNIHQFNSLTNASIDVSSSPMSPNSSRFSSIIQSSPLYHGYYVNNSSSSPTTSIFTSPVKYQMKPIEDFKKSLGELPKNPDNTPQQSRPTTPTPKSKHNNHYTTRLRTSISPKRITPPPSATESQFKVTLSIDETGQAKITKTPTKINIKTPTIVENYQSSPKRQKLTRHESLINIHHSNDSIPGIQRSFSTNKISFSDNYEPFFVSNDSFFNDIPDINNNHHSNHQHQVNEIIEENSFDLLNEENLISSDHENVEDVSDEDIDFDARKALIKMVRHSL